MTKVSDLPDLPDAPSFHRFPGKDPQNCFEICPQCGQAIDMRDLRQVLWHLSPDHEPLELDS